MPHLHFKTFLATVSLITAGQAWQASALSSQTPSVGLTFITIIMADNDVATRAPENDAKEPSMISSEDTPAQQGASMGVRDVIILS